MTMKILALIPCLLLYFAAAAHAEHKLLVTDILGPGEAEAEAGFSVSRNSYDFTFQPPPVLAPGPGALIMGHLPIHWVPHIYRNAQSGQVRLLSGEGLKGTEASVISLSRPIMISFSSP